ncbi:MAG TPA: hypothetical protein VK427_01530 [Kofleriaceae bacterium]|nr:hypothetical protein [Kofleriaceae bacterium]
MKLVLMGVLAILTSGCNNTHEASRPTSDAIRVVIERDEVAARARGGRPDVEPSSVRVALGWNAPVDTEHRPWVTQNVEIVRAGTSWPLELELAITEPPPAGAVNYGGYSQAKFVAYVDRDGNGQLDWTPVDAAAFTDEIVAYHPQLYLWFFDDGALKLMMPGSSALVEPSTPVTLLDRSDLRSSCHLLEWTPRFAFESQRHIHDASNRDQGPWVREDFPTCRFDVPPTGATVACQPGFDMFAYYTSWTTPTSTFIAETCGPVMRFCRGEQTDPPDGGDWPCPCDPTKYRCVDYQLQI